MYFRTVRTVDPVTGYGESNSDVIGNSVRFQRNVIAWDRTIEPIMGQCQSYEILSGIGRQPCARDMRAI